MNDQYRKKIENLSTLPDGGVAQAMLMVISVGALAGAKPEATISAVTEMVADIRAAERLRVERASAGAKVAAACLKETP
jgi:hypothetical protein